MQESPEGTAAGVVIMKYNFKEIEKKWQDKWEEDGVFHAEETSDKPKFYGLVEFPYPSGAGMHVGHIKAYSGLEVVSRKRRMQGYNVLFPIGSACLPRTMRSRRISIRVSSRIRIFSIFPSSCAV